MCFSAEASFSASAVILTIGAISLKKSTTTPQRVLSCIPIIFGSQQFSEGIEWLALTHPGMAPWDKVFSYVFLIFAAVIWPTVVPLAIWLLEKHPVVKKISGVLLVFGVIVSSLLAYTLIVFKVESFVSCSHIVYNIEYPDPLKHKGIFYFTAAVGPFLISTTKRVRLLGTTIFVSYLISQFFYKDYLISVWCFFAAIISVMVLSIIIKLNQTAPVSVVGKNEAA